MEAHVVNASFRQEWKEHAKGPYKASWKINLSKAITLMSLISVENGMCMCLISHIESKGIQMLSFWLG